MRLDRQMLNKNLTFKGLLNLIKTTSKYSKHENISESRLKEIIFKENGNDKEMAAINKWLK